MKTLISHRAFILFIAILCFGLARAQTVIYVDSAATGANNGSSWANAYTDLQQALAGSVAGDQIWVARGTYFPSDTNRRAYYYMKDNVSMYGGFAGNETSITQRIAGSNETILSGDIGVRGDTSDNTNHVLYAYWVYEKTVLDGFTIEYGHGTISIAGQYSSDGGGLYLVESKFTVSNCTFRYNYSKNAGGAIIVTQSYMLFNNCVFYKNSATQAGAISGYTGLGFYYNCSFLENCATGIPNNTSGGAIAGSGGLFYHCTFRKNFANAIGGAAIAWGGVRFFECVLDSNHAGQGGGAVYLDNSTNSFYRTTFSNNYTTAVNGYGGAVYDQNLPYKHKFENCNFVGNRAYGDGGAIYLYYSAARITNCIFNNNYSRKRGGAIAFISGSYDLEISNCNFVGNNADSAGKVFFDYNIWLKRTPVTNCVFANNGTPEIQQNPGSLLTKVRHCILQTADTGVGNVVAAPSFVNAAGTDGIAGTADDDFRLLTGTTGINAGLSDTSVHEILPEDYAGNQRIINAIDIGAHEWNDCTDTLSNAIAGNDTVLCGSYTQARLYSTPPLYGSGRWRLIEGNGYIDTLYSNNTIIQGINFGTTRVEWIVQNCGVTKRDTVTIVKGPSIPNVSISAGGPLAFCPGGSVTLSVPTGYAQYHWSNGAATSSITVTTAGTYSVSVTAQGGCTANSSASVTVTVYSNPAKPVITHTGDTVLCGSETLTLSTGTGYSAWLWTNGGTTSSITASGTNNYAVRVRNANGCWSVSSDTVRITQFANPAKPALTLSDTTVFCAGDSVVVTGPAGYTTYNWNNNTHLTSVTLYDTYNLYLAVIDNHGCVSPNSDTVHAAKVTVNTPTVTANGSVDFCTGDSVTLSAPAGWAAYAWSNGSTASFIKVFTQGSYRVRVQNAMGCWSSFSALTTVTVHGNPSKPVITAGGPLAFCQGQSVTLTSSASTTYLWSNGNTQSNITVTTGGSFSVRVSNQYGCRSVYSDTVQVVVYPLPSAPTIQASGATEFCPGGSVTLTASAGFSSYQWSSGAVSSSVTSTTSETLTVRGTDAHGCLSPASAAVSVTVFPSNAPPGVAVLPGSAVCAGDSIVLAAFGNYPTYYWSDGSTGPSVTLYAPATLNVHASDANGCPTPNSPNFSVDFIAAPPAPVITLQNSNEISTATQSLHYYWTVNDSALNMNAQSFTATIPGTYALVIEDNGCTSDTSNKLVVECAAYGTTPAVYISPNPNNGIFNLAVNGYSSVKFKVRVFDALGQQVSNEQEFDTDKCSLGNFAFDLSYLTKGVYVLKLTMNDTNTKIRWVKAK